MQNIKHLLYYLRSIITMINTGLQIQITKTHETPSDSINQHFYNLMFKNDI